MSFETTVELGIELDQGSLRSAKRAIESELGDVTVGVSGEGAAARATGGGGGGGAGGGRRERRLFRWARRRTGDISEAVGVLGDIDGRLEGAVGGDGGKTELAMLEIQRRTLTAQKESASADVRRNEILEEMLEFTESIDDKIEGGGGGGGLFAAAGGGLAGTVAAGAGIAAGGGLQGLMFERLVEGGPKLEDLALGGLLAGGPLGGISLLLSNLSALQMGAEALGGEGGGMFDSDSPFAQLERTALAESIRQQPQGGGRAANVTSVEIENVAQFSSAVDTLQRTKIDPGPLRQAAEQLEQVAPPMPDWVNRFLGGIFDGGGGGGGPPGGDFGPVGTTTAGGGRASGLTSRGAREAAGLGGQTVNIDNTTEVTVDADRPISELQRELEREVDDIRDEIERATGGIGPNP